MSAVCFKHSNIRLGWQVISVNTGLDMPVICTISNSKSCTMRKFDAMEARFYFAHVSIRLTMGLNCC